MSLIDKRAYSNEIYQLRYQGQIDSAIIKCQEAVNNYPKDNFFYKILGDLFVQKGDYENASLAYIHQLQLIDETPEYFKHFARFYHLYEKQTSKENFIDFQNKILSEVQKGSISPKIKKELESLFFSEKFVNDRILDLMKKTCDDQNLIEVKNKISMINESDAIRSIILWRISDSDNLKCNQTDLFFISVAEKYELYNEGLKLIKKYLSSKTKANPTVVRTMFRICRKIQNYSAVENLIKIDSQYISQVDFNIQFELVYYFEYKEDYEQLYLTLKYMRNSATSSIPIARTLYNFYIKFNYFDEAKEVFEHIRTLNGERYEKNSEHQVKERINEQLESEKGVWNKLQELISEQEHNRQMIAMRDLLKGFSHELGQPITNIRYSIQLHMMKCENGVAETNDIDELLKKILNQTERIGKLLGRFNPIVSSKSKNVKFNIFERITEVLDNLSARLIAANITYSLRGNKSCNLSGDPIQFDQVFYNLILNSMQAIIDENNHNGKIDICISDENNRIKICFKDNGPGIPQSNAKKIFEPFYSTKDKSTFQDGGEGLGLFIVWNVLKMFNGSIKLDNSYHSGAKFIISIKYKEDSINE